VGREGEKPMAVRKNHVKKKKGKKKARKIYYDGACATGSAKRRIPILGTGKSGERPMSVLQTKQGDYKRGEKGRSGK